MSKSDSKPILIPNVHITTDNDDHYDVAFRNAKSSTGWSRVHIDKDAVVAYPVHGKSQMLTFRCPVDTAIELQTTTNGQSVTEIITAEDFKKLYNQSRILHKNMKPQVSREIPDTDCDSSRTQNQYNTANMPWDDLF